MAPGCELRPAGAVQVSTFRYRSFLASYVQIVMRCIYNRDGVFDWDDSNLRKIRAHRLKRDDVEQALSNSPILIYEQNVGGEPRFVYYGETDAGWLLAVVLTERDDRIRVVTAYKLDAGQKRDYFARRLRGE
jgi:uncharacterized DUF497 family protein